MDFQQLLAKMAELDTPVAETAVETPVTEEPVAECPPDMSAPAAPAVEPSPSMSVNLNAQGLNNIADLIKLIAQAEEGAEADPLAAIAPQPVATELPAELPAPDLPAELPAPEELSDIDSDDEQKDEWANEPEEETKDADYMLNKLAGGINRPKTMYQHSYRQGDNPMAMEGEELRTWVKNELAQRLAEVKGVK